MKLKLSKKLFSILIAVVLLFGASVVNANTITLVNPNTSSPNVSVPADLGPGNIFAIDIMVNTIENAAFGVLDLAWNPGVISLNSVAFGPTFNAFGVPAITPGGVTGIFGGAVPFSNNTGDYLFATLNFTFNAGITDINVTGMSSLFGTWNEVGTGDTILFDPVTAATVSAVPVPPAMVLFATAIAGLGAARCRKA